MKQDSAPDLMKTAMQKFESNCGAHFLWHCGGPGFEPLRLQPVYPSPLHSLDTQCSSDNNSPTPLTSTNAVPNSWGHGGDNMDKRDITLKDAIEVTIKAKTSANLRPTYTKGLRAYLNLFARTVGESVPIKQIDAACIEQFFDQRSEKPATRHSNLGRLASMFGYCKDKKLIPENPCEFVEKVRIDKQSPRILTLPQIHSLLHAMQNRRGIAYIILCLFAGLRPSEAQQLTWPKIDLAAGTVTVDAAISKVRRRRIVHLMPAAVAWLRSSTQDVLPVSNRERKRILYLCCHILGFDSWPQDVYRHSCASYWIAERQDAGYVALQLGNSPKVLLTDYRELVSREQAREFWAIKPHVNGKQMELRL